MSLKMFNTADENYYANIQSLSYKAYNKRLCSLNKCSSEFKLSFSLKVLCRFLVPLFLSTPLFQKTPILHNDIFIFERVQRRFFFLTGCLLKITTHCTTVLLFYTCNDIHHYVILDKRSTT